MDAMYSFADDSVVRMFEPDLITPDQYRDRVSAELVDQPEVRLMLAVMEDAVATYQRYATDSGRRGRRLFEEAQDWIMSSDSSWPYSFENICHALHFNPDSLRSGLEEWRAARTSHASPVYRFPFRRVNGRRHSITGPREYLKKSA